MKRLLIVAALILLSCTTSADTRNPVLKESFALSIGGYSLEAEAEVSTQSHAFEHRTFSINLDDLGLDTDVNTYWIDAKWKPFERWSFMAEYFSYNEKANRNSQNSTSYEFTFQDSVFKGEAGINTNLTSEFDVDITSITIAYRLLDSHSTTIDLGLGIHAMDISLSLTGQGDVYINDTILADEITTESEAILAPLPNLVVYGAYAPNNQLALTGRAGWFSMNYDEYSGDLLRANAALEYRPIKNLGLGIGYNFSEIDVSRKKEQRSTSFDMDFSGPLFYIKGGF